MGGKTSTAAKNRYNRKTYDRIVISVKKHHTHLIHNQAEKKRMTTSRYIKDLIERDLKTFNRVVAANLLLDL